VILYQLNVDPTERRELYRFSADLAKLALRIADRYGTSGEKWCVIDMCPGEAITKSPPVGHKYCSAQWCRDLITSMFVQISLGWSKPSGMATVQETGKLFLSGKRLLDNPCPKDIYWPC
jgi:hypothetical protein